MKPIVMFVVGALGAATLVYMLMRPAEKTAKAPEPVAVAEVKPEPPAVVEPPPSETPEPATPPASASPAQASRPTVDRKPARVPVAQRGSKPGTPMTAPNTPAQSAPPAAPSQTSSTPAVTPIDPTPAAANTTPYVEEKKAPVRVPQTVTIPAGTLVTVRVDQSLSSAMNQTGDSFPATLDQPLVVDGMVIAERGSKVEGRIVEAEKSGKVQGRARISLELVRLNTSDGQRLRLQTDSFAKVAESDTKRDVGKVATAAGIGAIIGAIAGGGKGAAVGATVGGAAGTGGVLMTRGRAAEVPAETRMTFKLRDSITVTEKLQ